MAMEFLDNQGTDGDLAGSQVRERPTAKPQKKTLLVTGSTGFIGAHVTRELLDKGYYVYTIVRDKNKFTKLFGEKCHNLAILEGDLLTNASLEKLKQDVASIGDDFDAVVHMVGGGPLTSNSKFTSAIFDLNYQTTCNLVRLLEITHKLDSIALFVYFSSLAAMGTPRSHVNTIVYRETTSCEPVLPYERAKLRTENFLREVTNKHNFKTVVFRFPQVYGGEDDQFAKMIRLIRKGVFPVVRNKVGTLPLLHVQNAVKATCMVLGNAGLIQGNYDVNLISEKSYSYDHLSELVKQKYGTGGIVKLPYSLLYLAILMTENVFKVFGKPEPLNRRRLISMTKDRVVDCGKFSETFGFQYDHSLPAFMSDHLR